MARPALWHQVIPVTAGILLFVINNLYISAIEPFAVPLVNTVAGLIAVVPSVLIAYAYHRKRREIEEQFINFIIDFGDSLNAGMTLPMALEHCSKRNYLSLTPYVKGMAAQIGWGVPFPEALKIFASKTKSVVIKRSITTITEAYRVGGKIGDTLEGISKALIVINKLKKERSVSVYSQILSSYLIYFIFIFIIALLQIFLIPALQPVGVIEGAAAALPIPTDMISGAFTHLIIIQGFFAGLATGKMSEGTVIAGLKHSVLLVAIGYTVFSLVGQLPISFL